uniref:Uncharacterized protein AlNc14C297G10316 n=1 Tax=Albugo laibachii Nc14 TaxID=890382 RepID=F0WVI1_9STRA|nr:conserved hypothetical protein [Albugo laibachii Nc14]|eukprot:CCA25423.1 conserved hypothetical protein [Albugo laibachii Nc14]
MVKLDAREVERASKIESFTASTTWQKLFKNQHQSIMRARKHGGANGKRPFCLEGLNADETACFFEYIPTRTLTKKGEKTVWVRCGGKEKESVMVMLLGDSDGVKYPSTLVYKSVPSQIPLVAEENRVQRNGFGVRLWKRMKKIQERTK